MRNFQYSQMSLCWYCTRGRADPHHTALAVLISKFIFNWWPKTFWLKACHSQYLCYSIQFYFLFENLRTLVITEWYHELSLNLLYNINISNQELSNIVIMVPFIYLISPFLSSLLSKHRSQYISDTNLEVNYGPFWCSSVYGLVHYHQLISCPLRSFRPYL